MCAPTPNNGCRHVVLLIGPEYFLRKLGANLLGTNLTGANLLGANLLGANLLGSNVKHWSDSVNAVTNACSLSAGPQLEFSCVHSDGDDDSAGDDKQ